MWWKKRKISFIKWDNIGTQMDRDGQGIEVGVRI
jgi:hypothetical protein